MSKRSKYTNPDQVPMEKVRRIPLSYAKAATNACAMVLVLLGGYTTAV
jgi:hypothetical protein